MKYWFPFEPRKKRGKEIYSIKNTKGGEEVKVSFNYKTKSWWWNTFAYLSPNISYSGGETYLDRLDVTYKLPNEKIKLFWPNQNPEKIKEELERIKIYANGLIEKGFTKEDWVELKGIDKGGEGYPLIGDVNNEPIINLLERILLLPENEQFVITPLSVFKIRRRWFLEGYDEVKREINIFMDKARKEKIDLPIP